MLFIATIILNVFLIIIFLCLIIAYIQLCKEKSERKNKSNYSSFSFCNIMWLCFILLIDNLIRVIDTRQLDKKIQTAQAFALTYLDKIIIAIISIINLYDCLMKTREECYLKHQTKIFWITLGFTRLVNIALIGYYFIISPGITNYKDDNYEGNIYYYHKSSDVKVILDIAFDLFFLGLSLLIIIIMLISNLKKQCEVLQGEREDNNYCIRSIYYLFLLIINLGLLIESIFIIMMKIDFKIVDLIYLSSCLIVDLFYAVNKITISKLLECFSCKKDISNNKSPRLTNEIEVMQEGTLIQNENE